MNLSYILKTKFTAKAFQEYLRNKKPTQLAGYAVDCNNCSLARYLKHILPVTDVAVTDKIKLYDENKWIPYKILPLPVWAFNFIYFHDLNRDEGKRITIAVARKIASVAAQYAYRGINFETADQRDAIRERYKKQEKEWERLGTV